MQIRKQQLEPDMEQQTGSKLGKEYIEAIYCHPVYLTSLQSTSCEMPGCMTQAGIKILGRHINNLRYVDDTTLMAENEEELKSPLMQVKEEGELETGLKLNIQKTKIMVSSSINHFMVNRRGKWKQ